MRERAPGLPRSPVLSKSARGRALIAAASLVALSVTLLEQPETVEVASAAAAAPPHHAVTVPAFLGPLGATLQHSPATVDARTELGARPPAASRSVKRTARKVVKRASSVRVARKAPARPAASSSSTRAKRSTSTRSSTRSVKRHETTRKVNKPARVVKKRARKSNVRAPRGMAAVLAFARSQVGDSYRRGATGPNVWDCSGLTQAAYEKAGIRLPHQSGAQAARAYRISRDDARPGDLVVGPGHVGIYMGGGMMVDAGNPRVGVAYRKMYGGLYIKRLR